MEINRSKKPIRRVKENYLGEEIFLSESNTDVDNLICRNLKNHIVILDTIKIGKSYEYINEESIVEKMKFVLSDFNNYLFKSIESINLNEFRIFKENTNDVELLNLEQKIDFIEKNKKHYPSTSKIDFNKVNKLLNDNNKKAPNLREIAKKLNYKYITLYRAVKKYMGYRYLKSNRLNFKSNNNHHNYQLIYFCEIFCKLVIKEKYFIFIDECSFNSNKRSTKIWVNNNSKNILLDKSRISGVNLILSASKEDIIYFQISECRLNSEKFIAYLDKLEETILNNDRLTEIYKNNEIYLIMDNCSIHKSKEVKSYLYTKKFTILYLPSYSPYYNLCEFVFSNLKQKFYQTIYSSM